MMKKINTELIEKEMSQLISEGWSDGVATFVGTHNSSHAFFDGNISGKYNKPVSQDSIYDLASVTKIFFLTVVMSFVNEGVIDLDAQVGDYSKNFKNISSLKIFELMNFSVSLATDELITYSPTKEHALSLIHNIKILDKPGNYSDMGVIALYTLLDDLVNGKLHTKATEFFYSIGLKDTFGWTEYDACNDIRMQSYSRECLLKNDHFEFSDLPLGTVHDPKSRILGFSGHAGLFSTPFDISLFCQAMLSNTIISQKLLETISSPRYDYSSSAQHYGLLCYKKASIEHNSEIPFSLSDSAFAISGYTGTYIIIDPELDFFASICSNRIYNRYPNVPPSGIECPVFCTNDYVYRKDKLLKAIC